MNKIAGNQSPLISQALSLQTIKYVNVEQNCRGDDDLSIIEEELLACITSQHDSQLKH